MSESSSTIHPVPGGTITLRAVNALPPRQRKRLKPYTLALASPLTRLAQAGNITVDGQLADSSTVLSGADVALSLPEAKLFDDMQDETSIALLEGWSFAAPLPTTIDQLLDVDETTGQRGLYDAISAAAGKVMADSMAGNGFALTAANLADPASPTGASAA